MVCCCKRRVHWWWNKKSAQDGTIGMRFQKRLTAGRTRTDIASQQLSTHHQLWINLSFHLSYTGKWFTADVLSIAVSGRPLEEDIDVTAGRTRTDIASQQTMPPAVTRDLSMLLAERNLWTTFINTTYDISLDSQISLLPLGFSLHLLPWISFYLFQPSNQSGNLFFQQTVRESCLLPKDSPLVLSVCWAVNKPMDGPEISPVKTCAWRLHS